jgi:hypothetical protein
LDANNQRIIRGICIFCRVFLYTGIDMRRPKIQSKTFRYIVGFVGGLIIFVGLPEGARWVHGGAIAQQAIGGIYGTAPAPVIGDSVTGNRDVNVTTTPGQTGNVVGGESTMMVCPGTLAPGQGAIGTYVGPGGHMNTTVIAGGGSGSVTGYRSTMTVGGPRCK